jgi:hypothetical protein
VRARDKKRILKEYPFCVYCGGTRAADTVDHMPPIGMFAKRIRLPGLEVPSCLDCNRNSRVADDVAAFFAATRMSGSESETQHFREKVKAIANNYSHVLDEIEPSYRQEKLARQYLDGLGKGYHAFNVQGPIVSKLMTMFGAKCALALHYAQRRRALPSGGSVGVLWFTNFQALEGEIPQDLFELLPNRLS